MTEIYECQVCGVVSKIRSDLCRPEQQEDLHDYCGTTTERANICAEVRGTLPIVCANCGRPAEQPDLVCKPLVLG